MNKLDASHKCVLKHLETINKMNACLSQVETHLKAFALKVSVALHSKHKEVFTREDGINEKQECGWFGMSPSNLNGWRNSKEGLLTLAIQNIYTSNLLQSGSADPCFSYVYSPYRNTNANDTSTDQLISIVPPPSGFAPSLDSPYRGFIFQKELPALTPEEVCDPAKLEHYLTGPLVTLIEWYKSNESVILNAFA